MDNQVYYEHKNWWISVAYNSTYAGLSRQLIDETALVFIQKNGKRRFWILQHDVHEIYQGVKSLRKAKDIYIREHNKGNCAFWSDYNEEKDK